jgi:hypothetical protein
MVVAIALAAGIGPALTDAADMTAASLYPKAVDALEAATGGKVLEILFVDQKGHERFESVVAKTDQVVYMAVDPVTENVTKIAIKECGSDGGSARDRCRPCQASFGRDPSARVQHRTAERRETPADCN